MKQIKAIKEAIRKEQINELRILATKHGFINNKLRKKAWPLVLGIKTVSKRKQTVNKSETNQRDKNHKIRRVSMDSIDNMRIDSKMKCELPNKFSLKINAKLPQIAESKTSTTPTKIPTSCPPMKFGSGSSEYQQIEKDIGRSSLKYYNVYTQKGKTKSEASLSKILHNIFDENDDLHYIQGFNDVTSVFYAVCNNDKLALRICHKVAKTLLSDYIMINKDEHINIINYKLIFDIMQCYDKELSKLLGNAHDFISISISWQLTWFAHQITDICVISRIYDYCLCSDKLISSYLSAALMIYLKNQLLSASKQDISLFEFFTDFKWNQLDFNEIIHISESLYVKYSADLNEKFKQHINGANGDDFYYPDSTDSTDSPVPITPYTPWTPSATPRKSSDANNSDISVSASAFDNIDFDALRNANSASKTTKKRKISMHIRNGKALKAIKGFIDDHL